MYAAAVGSLAAMQRLVEAGVPVNAANDFGATPLMWGAGELPKVRYLLEKGANANAKSKIGRTPLFIAAAYDGSVEIARLLIAKGADVNAKEASGATVLATAAYSNNLDFVRLLLEKGANPNTTDLGGFTPLAIAAFNGGSNSTLLKLLLDRGLPVKRPLCGFARNDEERPDRPRQTHCTNVYCQPGESRIHRVTHSSWRRRQCCGHPRHDSPHAFHCDRSHRPGDRPAAAGQRR
jgi:ankyrin repeat protein